MALQLSEIDGKILRLLLSSEGRMTTHDISLELGVPLSTVQRTRKRLESDFLVRTYGLISNKVWISKG